MTADTDTGRAPSPFKGMSKRVDARIVRYLNAITGRTLFPYQAAVVRIGFALTFLLYLVREWPHRQELYGAAGPWSFGLAQRLLDSNGAFSVLMWSDTNWWFELVYNGTILVCLGLLLGWHTRTMSLLYMVGVLSLLNRSVLLGDGGDTLIHLVASYLVLTRCGTVWSLDARRRRRAEAHHTTATTATTGDPVSVALWAFLGAALAVAQATGFAELHWGWALFLWGMWAIQALWFWAERGTFTEVRGVLDATANIVHNAALLLIAAQVCILYATAGLYKIQGARWQDGTAVHYPLHLDYFRPWAPLSGTLDSSGLLITAITYGTVILQVAFPFTLLNRRVKNVLLPVLMAEHASIAVLCGLPFFSMAMVFADAVFLPTSFLRWFGDGTADAARRLFRRIPYPRSAAPPSPAHRSRATS
ncbi:HTTM domain-containing protein [Streptomyces sp. LaPpAH-108]|uniref:HTTM domain-containing protein n=1 Tax=Streptomyces sp. LaPpAH-108 TaxID=1155714 RepID=UPI0003805783|nr:HTTM domain-containing protein [Streptomyces sp. LaPpAH-108]